MRGVRLMTKREKTWFFPLYRYQMKINQLIFLVYFSGILTERVQPGFVNGLP
jgi:hypothetical protein